MEHTEQDIKNIDFGNRQLDNWLMDEDMFKKMLLFSNPLRWIIGSVVYGTLSKLGELVTWEKTDEQSRGEYIQMAIGWEGGIDQKKTLQIAKSLMVLSTLAEKRLITTTGL